MMKTCDLRAGQFLLLWRSLLFGALMGLASLGLSAENRSDERVIDTLSLLPDSQKGRGVYQHSCAQCHGRSAWGDPGKATPSLAGQHMGYLVKQMVDFTELERDVPEMHRLFADPNIGSSQRIADLSAFLSELPPNRKPQIGDSRDLPLGGSVYAMACAQCHGDSGEGGDRDLVPMLRSQHYSYLLLQIRSLATGHRFNADPDVLDLLNSLDAEKMQAVADFITRLTPPDRDSGR
jgi:cytochrome c553